MATLTQHASGPTSIRGNSECINDVDDDDATIHSFASTVVASNRSRKRGKISMLHPIDKMSSNNNNNNNDIHDLLNGLMVFAVDTANPDDVANNIVNSIPVFGGDVHWANFSNQVVARFLFDQISQLRNEDPMRVLAEAMRWVGQNLFRPAGHAVHPDAARRAAISTPASDASNQAAGGQEASNNLPMETTVTGATGPLSALTDKAGETNSPIQDGRIESVPPRPSSAFGDSEDAAHSPPAHGNAGNHPAVSHANSLPLLAGARPNQAAGPGIGAHHGVANNADAGNNNAN
eukprot:CAMPEP_0119556848 /NCGR_PEP_ID=MMETSP1352-20130426/8672_1 /TAXON_ID=265584 /ORGANISM="Stauroneis constricta, Strain CCMP1120" /LENGTH=290 /DNA_ID=CAMNT_0007603851 /DNA_START=99 /DNA_END=971 /DNA_ORIENTATION=+